ncbi:MAG TPA: DUF3106 domain-containing protein, partial [Candidatus Angelobacter sp.]|nr:DUF3106 domain-containing protein [Candidatus Angelobacter sp.]
MVIGAQVVFVFLLTGMISLNVPVRVNSNPSRGNARTASVILQAVQKNPNGANHPGGGRMGDWLQAHKDLPPDQQLKLLENDPNFKKQPPARQAALRERLRKFNSLPPARRDQALQRMDFL